jgi:Pyridoxal-phosphate dependent enzyme
MNSSTGEASLQIIPSVSTIREARRFLAQYFAPTRLIAAPFLSQTTGRNVYLKLETELPTGTFKVRGAFWALAQRMKKGQVQEVLASSTGNHGAAVAYAAKQFGIKAKIFLPTSCNPVKRGRIAALGGAILAMVGAGSVLCLARSGCDDVELESSISHSTAWPGCSSRTPRCFALQLLLWWRLRQRTGLRDAFRDSAQPKQREWRISLNRHGDSQRAGSQRGRHCFPFERQHSGRDGPGERDCRCGCHQRDVHGEH